MRLPNECICRAQPNGEKVGYVYASFLGDGTPIGETDRVFGEAFMCVCRQADADKQRRKFLVEFADLPPAPSGVGMWSFSGYQVLYPEQGQDAALQSVRDWCSGSGDNYKPWLALVGPVGTGKTHLACSAAWALIGQDIQVRYEYVPLLLDYLRQGYDDNSYHSRSQQVREAPVLILDDYNASRITEWAHEELLKIIHYRYEQGGPLLVTTNVALQAFEERIRSRLTDVYMSRVIPMVWKSYREGA